MEPERSLKTETPNEIGLGNKTPTKGKLVRLIGIVFLLLVGLSGPAGIIGKKRAQSGVLKVCDPYYRACVGPGLTRL